MKFKTPLLVFTFSVISFFSVGVAEDGIFEVDPEPFIPTSEWQTIKPNQGIPKGLHVRINLQTGLKEAKLLSETEPTEHKNAGSLSVIPNGDKTTDTSSDSKMDRESIKKALHKLKADEVTVSNQKEEAASNFRSFEELKKDFAALNLTMKTDVEIMTDLFKNYEKLLVSLSKTSDVAPVEDSLVTILTDLDYLVHQIDNAQEFAKSGGFSKIVLPSFNVTSPAVRTQVMRLLGSATQSNAQVQIAALEAGTISILLRVFALEKEYTVRSSALFALSCLVRRFPLAQLELIKQGGLAVFTSLFEDQTESNPHLKLQIKIITLMHDLISEKQFAAEDLEKAISDTNANLTDEKLLAELQGKKEKLRQYVLVNLEDKLVEHNWCQHLGQILVQQSSVTKDHTDRRDDLSSAIGDLPVRFAHDIIEKIVECLTVLTDKCSEHFRTDKKLHRTLNYLGQWYKDLSSKEIVSESDYYTHLSNLVNKLNTHLNISDVTVFTVFPKDEL